MADPERFDAKSGSGFTFNIYIDADPNLNVMYLFRKTCKKKHKVHTNFPFSLKSKNLKGPFENKMYKFLPIQM